MDAVVQPHSTYQRLVDRYIDIMAWPSTKRGVLLLVLVIPTLAAVWGFTRLALRNAPIVFDMRLIDIWTASAISAFTVLLLLILLATRGGREANWSLYVAAVVTGSLLVWFIHLLGTLTHPVIVWYPLVVVLFVLFVDERFGWFTFLYMAVLLIGVTSLELSGRLPHAPALLDRSLDAQVDLGMFSSLFMLVHVVFAFCFTFAYFSVSARKAQQERLETAHRELSEARARLQRGTDLIRRYVPTQLAEKILAGEHKGAATPERRKVTLFFSDVVGFTEAADQMEAEDLSALLNEYLSEMAAIADSFGATVNQFVGDGIMIFFGAPEATSDRDHALRAVRMALVMQQRMGELREKWFAEGIQTPFRIRIGINTGVASVGDFGSEGRTTYSAIGNQTNLTARIQDHCEPGRVLISHTTWALVQDEIPCKERGEMEVKGLHYPVRVYEVAETASPASA